MCFRRSVRRAWRGWARTPIGGGCARRPAIAAAPRPPARPRPRP